MRKQARAICSSLFPMSRQRRPMRKQKKLISSCSKIKSPSRCSGKGRPLQTCFKPAYACSSDLNLLWRNFQLLSTSFCEASISASHCEGFAIFS